MGKLDEFRKLNLKETKKKIRESVTQDLLIIQAINHIFDLNKVINILVKDLREWYSYHNPEFSRATQDHQTFVEAILSKKDKNPKDGLGADFSKEDLKPVADLSEEIHKLYKLKEKQEVYIESMMEKVCPNITAIAGSLIGAKLIQHAGSLRKLVMMPASTVQLLGAEEALFRHIKTGARCPKYGVLHDHPLVSKAKRNKAGKVARVLASKISIASRVDYGKGKFIGDKLMKEIKKKFE